MAVCAMMLICFYAIHAPVARVVDGSMFRVFGHQGDLGVCVEKALSPTHVCTAEVKNIQTLDGSERAAVEVGEPQSSGTRASPWAISA